METAVTVAIAYIVWQVIMPLVGVMFVIAGSLVLLALVGRSEKKRKARTESAEGELSDD